jgi:hypothetical protein
MVPKILKTTNLKQTNNNNKQTIVPQHCQTFRHSSIFPNKDFFHRPICFFDPNFTKTTTKTMSNGQIEIRYKNNVKQSQQTKQTTTQQYNNKTIQQSNLIEPKTPLILQWQILVWAISITIIGINFIHCCLFVVVVCCCCCCCCLFVCCNSNSNKQNTQYKFVYATHTHTHVINVTLQKQTREPNKTKTENKNFSTLRLAKTTTATTITVASHTSVAIESNFCINTQQTVSLSLFFRALLCE